MCDVNHCDRRPLRAARVGARGRCIRRRLAPDSPAAFAALIVSEIARWKPVVERANMRTE